VYSVGEVYTIGTARTAQWLSMLTPSTSADLSKDWNVVQEWRSCSWWTEEYQLLWRTTRYVWV